ncbi:MAG: YidC/Oxa1 family membrane protein insertase [Clostridia bacterium]|nr:YidC/Oxa1 family membrane protein insertase [Clostridia bacterium]
MFSWLYKLLGTMLGWFSSIFGGSYALGLLLYALVFKVVFLPFAIKQQKSQIAMAKLAPKISLIRAKYKGRTDRVSIQERDQKIMELQQKEGYNPLSGCLPMLIQLPLIICLYNVIRKPISYIAKFTDIKALRDVIGESAKNLDEIGLIGEITANPDAFNGIENFDISKLPNFNLFGVNLADTPSFTNFSILVIIPVLAAVSQWFTGWLTRKLNSNPAVQPGSGDDQSQMSMKIMEFVMPAMTMFIAFGFSGMLGLYWIYQSVFSIIQILLLAKFMPIPKLTEAEIKAMRKAEKEAEKANRAALKEQPKHRSLHYIDEDDYDELPEVKKNESQKKIKSDDVPEIKD